METKKTPDVMARSRLKEKKRGGVVAMVLHNVIKLT